MPSSSKTKPAAAREAASREGFVLATVLNWEKLAGALTQAGAEAFLADATKILELELTKRLQTEALSAKRESATNSPLLSGDLWEEIQNRPIASALFNQGVGLAKVGRFRDAIAAFRQAKKVEPNINRRREITLLIKQYVKNEKEAEFDERKKTGYTCDPPPSEPAVIPRPPMGEPSEAIDRLEGNRARLPGMGDHEQEEGHFNEPLQRLITLLQEHPEITDDVLRSTNEILERKSLTPWLERSEKPELANLTAPAFLREVWAKAAKADGSFDRSAIKDKELLNAVSAYIGDREARIRAGTAVGFGDAEGLRLNKGKAGRPKLARPSSNPSGLNN
jgi:hypothetical protein